MRTPGIAESKKSDLSPYGQAKMVYSTEPCARSFEEDLELHLEHGYVFNTPKFFLMGRPVDTYASGPDIVDPTVVHPRANAWLVYLAAGDMSGFFSLVPYPLKFIGWERDNKLRFYRFDVVRRKTLHDNNIEIGGECHEIP